MTKHGLIVLTLVALGAGALVRSPVIANEAAPEPAAKADNGAFQKEAAAIHGADVEWLGRELKLTDPQKEQLRALDRDLEQQVNDILQDSLLSGEDKKHRIGALHEGLETRIKAVLTSDQIQKFDQMGGLKALSEPPPHRFEGIAVLGEHGSERLDLTDAQKAAIEQVLKASKEQAVAAGDDVTKLRAIKLGTRQSIMAILTPAQQQKLAAAKSLEIENAPGDGMRMPELGSLGLSAEQHERLMTILEQAAPRAKLIKGNAALSEAAKQAQMTALYQEFQPRFLSVLTPAQELKLRALLLDQPHQRAVVPEGGEPGGK